VFEPKFTTKSSGMGLGLGMVKNIVETYNGSISFTSKAGKGTVFTVRFPKEAEFKYTKS
jgi:signal transduction histidine kinase